MDEKSRHRQFEDQFLRQLRTRAEMLVGGPVPAQSVETRSMPDGANSVRDALSRIGIYDREILETMPGRQALQLRFDRPKWAGLLRHNVAQMRAQVLVSVEAIAKDTEPGPIDREAVLTALARYELLPKNQKPTIAIFASPTGFTPEAQALVDAGGKPGLVLMGGREDGGWDVAMPAGLRRTPWQKLFELETSTEQFKRFERHLDTIGVELDTRGVSIPELSQQLGISEEKTELLVRQACRLDARLMTVNAEGGVQLCRSPFAEEDNTMSFWSRIFGKIFHREPTVAQRVRELTTQRVQLEQQRHEVDQTVDKLELQERDLLEAGAKAPSAAEKKQVAGKLIRLRRELSRHKTRAQMFSQQVDVIGTQIHHLTLTEQTKKVSLPTADELAKDASEAEQAITELAANADLANNIEVSATSPMMAEEEDAIFAEFEEVAQRSSAGEPASSASEESAAAEPETPAEPKKEKDRPAGPELG